MPCGGISSRLNVYPPPRPQYSDWAETGNATIVVPAIAVAESYYLSVKLGQAFTPTRLLAALDSVGGIELSDIWSRTARDGSIAIQRFQRCTTGSSRRRQQLSMPRL